MICWESVDLPVGLDFTLMHEAVLHVQYDRLSSGNNEGFRRFIEIVNGAVTNTNLMEPRLHWRFMGDGYECVAIKRTSLIHNRGDLLFGNRNRNLHQPLELYEPMYSRGQRQLKAR